MRWFALAAALFSLNAAAVVITVQERVPVLCPQPRPPLQKLSTGVYEQSAVVMSYAVSCTKLVEWQEEWTADPESGGQFVRRVINTFVGHTSELN